MYGARYYQNYRRNWIGKAGRPKLGSSPAKILDITHPQLAKEWDYDKNKLTPSDVTAGSGKKVWWICKQRHSWQTKIVNRSRGSGCPKCLGRFNMPLSQVSKELVAEWDSEKNKPMTPADVPSGANRKVWWKCKNGHSWKTRVNLRVRGSGCPICSGKLTKTLQEAFPELAMEWDLEKNAPLSMSDVSPGSGKKVWWKCDKGHSWKASIALRGYAFRHGRGACPKCPRKLKLRGKSLLEGRPDLAAEWDPIKNLPLTPVDVSAGSREKIWWGCDKGHSWEARISHRAKGSHRARNGRAIGSKCPFCPRAVKIGKSLAEKAPELLSEWDFDKNTRPPSSFSVGSEQKVWWKCSKCSHSWKSVIKNRTKNLRPAGCPQCHKKSKLPQKYRRNSYIQPRHYRRNWIAKAGRPKLKRMPSKTLEITHPQLAEEWDYTKNALVPSDVTAGSNKKVWWLCNQHHSWQTKVNNRNRGTGCPQCAGKLRSDQTLDITHPQLVKEWDYANNDLTPSDVTAGSRKKVWWICNQQHSWQAIIFNRSHGSGCPQCAGKGIRFEQTLDITHPQLLEEWDYDKNDLAPFDVTAGSQKKVWWICNQQHSWQAAVRTRTSGSGCPQCAGKLQTLNLTHPQLLKEWNYAKNDLVPSDVTAGSEKKVWWVCNQKHSWQAAIYSRSRGSGCSQCKASQPLDATHPQLVQEWDSTKNELTPSDVSAGSPKKVWWVCNQQHSWQARVSNRSRGSGCPQCYKQGRLPQKYRRNYIGKAGCPKLERMPFKTVDITHPQLGKEWDYDKNDLDPSDVTAGSKKKVWWLCNQQHSWQARVDSRSLGRGCPQCAGKVRSDQTLDITHPQLVKEWDNTKNDLGPSDVTAGSNKEAWWLCNQQHSWQAVVYNRSSLGRGCPQCAGRLKRMPSKSLDITSPQLAAEWDYIKNALVPSDVTAGSNKKVWWLCNQQHSWQAVVNNRSHGRGCSQCAKKLRSDRYKQGRLPQKYQKHRYY